MSIPKISGRQARNLLDGTTPGPWQWRERLGGDTAAPDRMTLGTEFQDALKTFDGEDYLSGVYGSIEDLNLVASAPELAETVAWLYGREPDGPGAHVHRGRTGEYDQEAVASHPESGVVEVYVAHDHGDASAFLTPDEAVDLARALLAAAEEARRG